MPKSSKGLSWFRMRAAVNGVAQLDIFGDIGGYGINFPMFARQLEQLGLGAGDTLKIRINSDGGDVYQGFAIYQALALHPARKEITVMGLAASMASVVFMAGDKRVMPANATLMIHNPVGQIIGQSEEIIAFGEGVGEMKNNIAAAYADASDGKLTLAKAIKLMDRQSWVGSAEALRLGLATEVMPSVKIAAKFDLSRYANAPKNVGASFNSKESVMSKARNRQEFDFEDDAAATAAMRTEVRAEVIKANAEITALCAIAGKPDLAAEFIEDDMTLSEVVSELDKLAKADKTGKSKRPGGGTGGYDASASGNRREQRRDQRDARSARDSRGARGGDAEDEISARSAINLNGGESSVPEINATKIWDRWNKAGVAA
jgi:ATP-dependent protease ClpP protease subunit